MITQTDLKDSLPDTTSPVKVPGLSASVEIYRDRYGIPHVQAKTVEDAFWGQGFATAQDRLWHMDYDRHRAYGRWAELAGPAGLEQDLLMRRFCLEASARSDYQIIKQEARSVLEAYASGVNAFIETTKNLPIEYRLVERKPEPWQPWDCLAVFKVRHILMGTFEGKAWRARLLNELGPEKTAQLHPGYQPGYLLILPPGAEYDGPTADALKELEKGAAVIDRLKELEQGSNNWTLSEQLTASGKPLLAGDPHRGLDTPNVYYQNHMACPDFDAVGLSFPGVPGFPHFGHSQWVCWGVTHTGADYQDLFLERFRVGDPSYYQFKGQWRRAEVHREVIKVRGAADENIEVTVTLHGPVITGDPTKGVGVAFRYTQTAEANRNAECLLKMLQAKSTFELDESMRQWVDPINNFLFSDVHGNIGYLTRGRVPIRSQANAWLPVPGWTGEHEWEGFIPFNEMPRSHNPEAGYIVTANQRVVDKDYPYYIGLDHAPEFRARRITLRLQALKKATVEDMGAVHADRVSIPAQHYLRRLASLEPKDEASKEALAVLKLWDGDTDRDSVAATIYSAFRLHLDKRILRHLFGPLADDALTETNRGGPAHVTRLRAHFLHLMDKDDISLLPPGTDWTSLMSDALSSAVEELTSLLGSDISAWKWGKVHHTAPQHPLSTVFPEAAGLLDPPSVPLGGDGDTPQSASYSQARPYAITSTSVLRYIYDLADWSNSRWVVPLGASGHPGSPHYADQASIWGEVDFIPMLYDWQRIADEAESRQALSPKQARVL
ncbi:MAG: penicillin acylase family protein [Dehalococcoidia bacterium]